jgi:hypothetical protein
MMVVVFDVHHGGGKTTGAMVATMTSTLATLVTYGGGIKRNATNKPHPVEVSAMPFHDYNNHFHPTSVENLRRRSNDHPFSM